MNVSSILRRKGTHVETARPETSLASAARRLATKGIGSLAVLDEDRRLVGVLSERDVVRAFSEHGQASWGFAIQDVLGNRPATCTPADSLRDVMSIMTKRRARHLPVVVGEALVGLISIGDVVQGLLADLELEVGVLRDYARTRLST